MLTCADFHIPTTKMFLSTKINSHKPTKEYKKSIDIKITLYDCTKILPVNKTEHRKQPLNLTRQNFTTNCYNQVTHLITKLTTITLIIRLDSEKRQVSNCVCAPTQ